MRRLSAILVLNGGTIVGGTIANANSLGFYQ